MAIGGQEYPWHRASTRWYVEQMGVAASTSSASAAISASCLGCGYSRAGIARDVPCPECGEAPRSALDELCLGCGYPRVGLGPEAPCPECGEAPPPESWIVVRGWSQPGNPWLGLVGGTIFLLIGAAIFWSVLRTGRTQSFVGLIPCLSIPFAGLAMVLAGVRRLRATPTGGDVTWIVKERDMEVRMGDGRATIPLRAFKRCRRIRSITRRWERLSLTPRFWTISGARRLIWVRRGTVDTQALQRSIASRLEKRPWWRW